MKRAGTRSIRLRAGTLAAVIVLAGVGVLGAFACADDAGVASSRAVRLSYVEGDVHLVQGNQALTDQALANTPLFEGTRVVTGSDGRAEIQFEDGSVARISPESSLTLTSLKGGTGSERESEVQLNGGLGYFEIQGDDGGHLRVRFDDSAVTATGFTVLRINMDNKPGAVAVFSGNAHIEGTDNLALDLHGGESVALNGNDPNAYNLSESIEPDSWDAWNSDRDQALTTASTERTPATGGMPDSNNPAWGDLDQNGNWYNVPDQGYVWSPYEASSPTWDPYGTGSWMWAPGFGYQWISAEPWGYLPYQCGAWNYYNSFGWGWAPGMCQPWWGGGGGWIVNIGTAPPRYRFPVRPTRPYNPRPMGGIGDHPGRPLPPIIPVNRRLTPVDTVLPSRDKSTNVTIAGNVVQPIRPVEVVRMPYNHSIPAFRNPQAPNLGTNPANNRSGYVIQGSSTYRPGTPSGNYNAPRPSSGAVYAHPSAPAHYSAPSAPASHPSGGGGGGHPSGGGGGGGGSHPSGGSPHH
jgi:hypothetical protein